MKSNVSSRLFNALGVFVILFLFNSCAIQNAQKKLLSAPPLKGAHLGIAVYNDARSQWVTRYQSDHYFTPASNTKILATYVGLQYLGDSLPGWKMAENSDTIFLFPQGDPSFFHPEFAYQPVVSLIKNTTKQIMIATTNADDQFGYFGDGWAWNDYNEDYQPERARMPLYGNVLHIYSKANQLDIKPASLMQGTVLNNESTKGKAWTRDRLINRFYTTNQKNTDTYIQVPFIHNTTNVIALLNDTLGLSKPIKAFTYNSSFDTSVLKLKWIKTIPTDTLLKIMMSRSDNFYAEQIILMASAQQTGKMNDGAFIESVIKQDLSELPQPIRWADGSGLSRYNLNTPENYIALLKQMQTKFGEARVRNIFEKGGEGTLSAYYKNFPGEIYAKTGTLGGQIALSGFMYTPKKQKWYFSVLVANHVSKTTMPVRKAVEAYLTEMAKRN